MAIKSVAIIVSTQDIAGMNIKNRLIHTYKFRETSDEDKLDNHPIYQLEISAKTVKLYTIDSETIERENIDKEIEADLFIFATRHQSKSGIKTLSVHSPGNWDKAEFGGKDRSLCVCPALYLRSAFLLLNERAGPLKGEFDIVNECTHHGPYILSKPAIFIEIGSEETAWKNEQAGSIIADVIHDLIAQKIPEAEHIAIGIGGQHTCENFNKIVLDTNIAIGHICPKYMLDLINKEMITQAIDRTSPKANVILVDYKGLGKDKTKIKEITDQIAKETGIIVKRTSNF